MFTTIRDSFSVNTFLYVSFAYTGPDGNGEDINYTLISYKKNAGPNWDIK
jgi:hypothetical protein